MDDNGDMGHNSIWMTIGDMGYNIPDEKIIHGFLDHCWFTIPNNNDLHYYMKRL